MVAKLWHLSDPNSIFTSWFLVYLKIIGLSLSKRKTIINILLFCLFLIRWTSLLVFEVIYPISAGFKILEIFANLTIFIYPVYGFIHLFINLNKFAQQFGQSCRQISLWNSAVKTCSYVKNMHRSNTISLLMIFCQAILYYCTGMAVMYDTEPWVIRRTIPTRTSLAMTTERTIAMIVFIYEALIVNYVQISVAVYLSFHQCVMIFKRMVLERLPMCDRRCSLLLLNQLEEMMNIFESYLSLLPFNWLAYCISPSLCTLLSLAAKDHVSGNNRFEALTMTIHYSVSLATTLASLQVISRREERLKDEVNIFIRSMKENATRVRDLMMIERTTQVLLHPPTFWHICVIDRLTILTYIGSAITFSTLFFQLSK